MKVSQSFLVYSALIFIQLLFGVNFSTSKVLVGEIDPVIWSNIRFFFAFILMLPITLLMKRKHPPLTKDFLLPIIPLALLGMALGQGLFLFGLKYTTSINTSIITTLIPILTLTVVVLRRQEKLTWFRFLGIVLAFIGVLLLKDLSNFTLSSNTFLGDFLVFLGALCFALYLSYGKAFLQRFDNLWITTWMFGVSALAMFLYNIPKWADFIVPPFNWTVYLSAAYTIIGATILTYFLNNWVLKRAPSGNVAIFIYLQPLVAGAIGFFFLGETITMRMVISTLMILGGMVLTLQVSKRK